ncbi:N-alpha-acetyltransferase 30 [Coemansia sp. RSA 1290]|nr:putative acyltransfersase [Coemansia mojavensis]KAJ2631644.1 N-alpha-acetyltransferase 30 [Coemansia sp. RSA 1290]KAJ2646862.1 n-terminal acetyltransferase c complex catalytic subunit mak3 [Coemansia sp. RSA 1250]
MATVEYRIYEKESDLEPAMALIDQDLSEPYSIYTYRYFVQQWPSLCILAFDKQADKCIGVIICKLEPHKTNPTEYFGENKTVLNRGYIGMVAVDPQYRKQGVGSSLVVQALDAMKQQGADEVILEAETSNKGALALYERLGFIREKRLYRYYLSGADAFRLKLWL